jgi:hypothetical protein
MSALNWCIAASAGTQAAPQLPCACMLLLWCMRLIIGVSCVQLCRQETCVALLVFCLIAYCSCVHAEMCCSLQAIAAAAAWPPQNDPPMWCCLQCADNMVYDGHA